MPIRIEINSRSFLLDAPPMKRLLDVLREDCRLTGTKEGCGEGECGACSVIVDGEVVNSCLIPVCQVEGSSVTTVEGLALNDQLSPLQRAFLEYGAAQCGICTPGMLMSAHALLLRRPHPIRNQILEAIAGNLCRCTGYTKILDAIAAVSSGNINKPDQSE
ncbi:MAG: (2Fe-2S)-binding protein [Blastocatellales bacterium]|nr:(2Fe-2S)-binding protein [Blastocatellales bacterium]